MALLPPPDISAAYVEEKTGRPSKDFYNWIKSLYDSTRNAISTTAGSIESLFSVRSYGADETITDAENSTAYLNAQTAVESGKFFVPTTLATIQTNLSFGDIETMCWWGQGTTEIFDGSRNINIPSYYTGINEAPAFDDTDYIGFGGDPSRSLLAGLLIINGTDTLGTPATGYFFNPNASAFHVQIINNSGHNEDTASSAGRTAGAGIYLGVNNLGQGDFLTVFVNGSVSGTRPGATHFLASPAVSMYAGQLFAGADGVYLQGIGDINLTDSGFDCAAVSYATILERDNDTGALGVYWSGVRIQSNGAAPIDQAFCITGKTRCGLDLTGATFESDNIAIAIPELGRVYLKTDYSTFPRVNPGDVSFWFSSDLGMIVFDVGATDRSPRIAPFGLNLREIDFTPDTPAAGDVLIYAREDHIVRSIGSDGVVRALS